MKDGERSGAALEMHVEWSLRIGSALFAAGGLAFLATEAWWKWIALLLWGAVVLDAWREYVRVEDLVLYRRGAVFWSLPVDLRRLASVELVREWGRPLYKYLVLRVVDLDGNRQTIHPWLWSGSKALLRLVAEAASEPSPVHQGERVWRLETNRKTRQRLANHV